MIRTLARLFRLKLALLNGIAAVAGCLLSPVPQAKVLAAAFCGVALLAAGGSALNQVLERDQDRLMARTRLRPLPQGELTPKGAALIGALPILAGLLLLAVAGGALPLLIGAFALVWYLGVYTLLKRRSSLALLSGALCGALPPLIGWCLAGGRPADYRVVLLGGVMYLWQVPHFWLFQRRHAADYRNAGFRLLEMTDGAGSRLLGLWIASLIVAAMLLPAFGIIGPHAAPWYALFPLPLILMAFTRREQALFPYLNLFPLMVTIILLVQK